ncbi:MAG: chemotaxis protein CheW [Xanthomonadaceae bacterium]|jgi:chemosensory pili system protein ChpC|nr:chemotaxis protein CheW [Xanthomonadaceae bacterium]
MNAETTDLRGVLIAVGGGGRLLLPNANIAEVISYSPPEALPGVPAWLRGNLRWRGWRLPVLSFPGLVGWPAEDGGLGAKLVVLKALGGNPRLPYFAVVSQGFPRLVSVGRERLLALEEAGEQPLGVLARVQVGEDVAVVPDLLTLELLIDEALAKAA